jgi:type I restriction enzyme S subunit
MYGSDTDHDRGAERMSLPRYPTYKDSGVEWLGEVPAHWDVRKIKWLCQIKKRISGELGHDVLSITQQGIKIKDIESNDGQISMDYSKYQFVNVGDFAMNHMDLLTGYVDISDVFGVTSPDYRVFSIRDQKDCYDRYVLYLFQMGYRNKIFYAFGQGSSQLGRWRLPTEQFNDFFFPLPSIEEQQTIATFLDRETGKIDALIAEQRRLVELLAKKRQAVISHAVTKGLNPNAPMKDSGIAWLGDVPAHWEISRIKRYCYINDGNHGGEYPSAEDYTDEYGGVPFIRAGNISGLSITSQDMLYITQAKNSSMRKGRLQTGDILFTNRGEIGKIAVIPSEYEGANLNSQIAYLRSDKSFVVNKYLAHYLTSDIVFNVYDSISAGSVLTQFPIGDLKNIPVILPPIVEQTDIATFLDTEAAKFDTLTVEASRAITLLQERRSALISAAVTGKIDVRKAA